MFDSPKKLPSWQRSPRPRVQLRSLVPRRHRSPRNVRRSPPRITQDPHNWQQSNYQKESIDGEQPTGRRTANQQQFEQQQPTTNNTVSPYNRVDIQTCGEVSVIVNFNLSN
ncbi:hypothetical protein K0M31_011831 [Melipona bicolor]|uniref:Uncharacterized protein n=1 Tax=Melipona bicolor TaxID=60889 RepID=A0AA40KV30_9HYME|nr:hypothetical protein K0M31_011831 [Melipona bicolor]